MRRSRGIRGSRHGWLKWSGELHSDAAEFEEFWKEKALKVTVWCFSPFSVHFCSFGVLRAGSALSYRFEEEDCRSRGNIKRVALAEHWDFHLRMFLC